jgi:hypothetical protein
MEIASVPKGLLTNGGKEKNKKRWYVRVNSKGWALA